MIIERVSICSFWSMDCIDLSRCGLIGVRIDGIMVKKLTSMEMSPQLLGVIS